MSDTAIAATLAKLQAGTQAATKNAKSGAATHETVKRVSQQFEALFISEMLAPVFNSVDTDGLFGGGQGEKVFRSMMVDEYGKAIAKAGGVGIADAVQNEILKMQEKQK